MARVMLAATGSGCGKTTITCAVLQALKNRGMQPAALKCGPDYIDPMFHRTVTGTAAGNLDSFFMEPELLRATLGQYEREQDICVLEGAMGYYDGIGSSTDASAWHIAVQTDTPVILIVSCRGMGCNSIAAVVRGFLQQENHHIAGVIFNQLSAGLYPEVCEAVASLPVTPLGYFPKREDLQLGSRHLGLVTAMELENLQETMHKLAAQAEETLNLDGIMQLAQSCAVCDGTYPELQTEQPVTVAVAKDRAFCFHYKENLELLQRLGAQLLFFSPLEDAELPACDALYLCGGYPELYGEKLAANETMRSRICEKIAGGLPVIAECGGFLYLQQTLRDADGTVWPMAGAIAGNAWPTDRLQRFGYITLTAQGENLSGTADCTLRGHEFHYWESDACGDGFLAQKAGRKRSWSCVQSSSVLYAGFPHLYFYSNPEFLRGFLRKAAAYGKACRKVTDNQGDR